MFTLAAFLTSTSLFPALFVLTTVVPTGTAVVARCTRYPFFFSPTLGGIVIIVATIVGNKNLFFLVPCSSLPPGSFPSALTFSFPTFAMLSTLTAMYDPRVCKCWGIVVVFVST